MLLGIIAACCNQIDDPAFVGVYFALYLNLHYSNQKPNKAAYPTSWTLLFGMDEADSMFYFFVGHCLPSMMWVA
jgi:hypothetical protein